MKKVVLVLFVALFFASEVEAQDSGFSAGYSSLVLRAKASGGGVSDSDSDSASGFFVGYFKEKEISETISFRPGIELGFYKKDGESSTQLLVPILFKYSTTDNFGLLFGPQVDYLLDDDTEGMNKVGLGISVGLELGITERLFLIGRYSLGVSERLKEDSFDGVEVDARFDNLNIGLTYKF